MHDYVIFVLQSERTTDHYKFFVTFVGNNKPSMLDITVGLYIHRRKVFKFAHANKEYAQIITAIKL